MTKHIQFPLAFSLLFYQKPIIKLKKHRLINGMGLQESSKEKSIVKPVRAILRLLEFFSCADDVFLKKRPNYDNLLNVSIFIL